MFQHLGHGLLDANPVFRDRMLAGLPRLQLVDAISQQLLDRVIHKLDLTIGANDANDVRDMLDDIAKPVFAFEQLLPGGNRLRYVAADAAVSHESAAIGKKWLAARAQYPDFTIGAAQGPNHRILVALQQRFAQAAPLVEVVDASRKRLFTGLADDVGNRYAGNFLESAGLVSEA